MATTSPLKSRLEELEERITSLRDERKPLAQRAADAKRAFAAQDPIRPDSEEARVATSAMDALNLMDAKIEDAKNARVEVLRALSGNPAAFSGHDGWNDLARGLDLEAGRTRVSVPAGTLLRAQAPGSTGTLTDRPQLQAPAVGQAVDSRYLYTSIPQVQIGPEALAIAEFRVTRGELSGNSPVLRDPTSTDPKAELPIGIEYVSEDVKQVAVVVEDVPNAVLAADSTLQTLLTTQMRAELDRATDDHLTDQIEAAGPLHGQTAGGLIEELRAAVGTLRAAGFRPSVAAVNPDDSAQLDLTTTGADGAYVFGLDVGAAQLWQLRIVEVSSGINPTVIDPAALGTLYAQTGTLVVDGYTGLERNVSRLRLETNVLAHVRDAAAAYIVSS